MAAPERVTEVKTRCSSCGSNKVRSTFVGSGLGGMVIRDCDGCSNRKGSYAVKSTPSWAREPVPADRFAPVSAESLYRQLRKEGQVTVGEHLEHLVAGVRYRAKRDGLIFGSHTTRLGQRGLVGWDQKSIALFIHDGQGTLVFLDAPKEEP